MIGLFPGFNPTAARLFGRAIRFVSGSCSGLMIAHRATGPSTDSTWRYVYGNPHDLDFAIAQRDQPQRLKDRSLGDDRADGARRRDRSPPGRSEGRDLLPAP